MTGGWFMKFFEPTHVQFIFMKKSKSQVKTPEEHRNISKLLLEILGDRLVEQVTPFAKEQEDNHVTGWTPILLLM